MGAIYHLKKDLEEKLKESVFWPGEERKLYDVWRARNIRYLSLKLKETESVGVAPLTPSVIRRVGGLRLRKKVGK